MGRIKNLCKKCIYYKNKDCHRNEYITFGILSEVKQNCFKKRTLLFYIKLLLGKI